MKRPPARARQNFAWVAIALALATSSAASAAGAEEALVIDVDGADAAPVEDAIRREVAGLVPAPSGRVTVRRKGSTQATVVFVGDDGKRVERSIEIQSDTSESAAEIGLLAANMMRDDTAELGSFEEPTEHEPEIEPKTDGSVEEPAAPPSVPSTASRRPRVAKQEMTPASSQDPCRTEASSFPVGIDFLPYVGTSSISGARDATRYAAMNFLGGLGSGLVGVEIGSLFNVETSHMCGAQMAGIVNVVGGPARGVQISGLVDVAGEFQGAQLSGLVNVAAGDVTGVQMTGLVNVASGRVRGVQVGLINVAEKSDFSLGLVNINTKGRTHIDVFSELEIGLLATAVKHGGDHWHGLYGVATRLTEPSLIGFVGLGGHLRFLDWLYLDLDVIGHALPSFKDAGHTSALTQARSVVGFNVVEQLAIYAGPSFNALFRQSGADDFSPGYAMGKTNVEDASVPMWPGVGLGIQGIAE